MTQQAEIGANPEDQDALEVTQQQITKKLVILKPKEAYDRAGVSPATAWRLRKKGQFPSPVRRGLNGIGFLEHEIDSFIRALMAERVISTEGETPSIEE